jgi:hypothetical protein
MVSQNIPRSAEWHKHNNPKALAAKRKELATAMKDIFRKNNGNKKTSSSS